MQSESQVTYAPRSVVWFSIDIRNKLKFKCGGLDPLYRDRRAMLSLLLRRIGSSQA